MILQQFKAARRAIGTATSLSTAYVYMCRRWPTCCFFFYNDVTANVLCQQLEFRIIIDCLFMHICWPSPVALLFLWEQLLFYIHVLVANAALTSIISDSSEEWRCLFLKKKCKTNLPKYSRSINTITITSISHSLRTFVPIWNCKARYH